MIKFSRRGAVAGLVIHSVAVISFAVLVSNGLQHSPEASTLWLLWIAIDFPTGLLFIPFDGALGLPIQDQFGFRAYHVYGCALFFLILGGLQYALIVGFIGGLVRKAAS